MNFGKGVGGGAGGGGSVKIRYIEGSERKRREPCACVTLPSEDVRRRAVASSGLGSSRNKPAVHRSTQMQMRASGHAL